MPNYLFITKGISIFSYYWYPNHLYIYGYSSLLPVLMLFSFNFSYFEAHLKPHLNPDIFLLATAELSLLTLLFHISTLSPHCFPSEPLNIVFNLIGLFFKMKERH